jgi:hypothetical protein
MTVIASEVEALREIAAEDWYTLSEVGDECEGFKTIAREEQPNRRWSRTVYVVTRSPSGTLLRWQYEHGLTESQDNEFYRYEPIVEVTPVEKVIVTTEYQPV